MRVPFSPDLVDLPEAPPPPGAAAVVATFAALALLRRETAASLPEPRPGIAYDPDAFAAGTPLLANVAPEEIEAGFLAAAALLLPGLAAIFPAIGREATGLSQTLARQPRLARPLLDAALGGLEDDLAALSDEIGLPAAALAFLTHEILAAVLRREAAHLAPLADDALWQKSACPVCGAGPDIGMLKEKPEQSEFLIAKAGRLMLHCSLCGHLWRFARLKCPACGEVEQDKLELLIPAGRERERIHVCTTCGHYLIVLNRVDSEIDLDLDVAPAGLSHLDAVAQAKGYLPLCPAPWNQFDPE